MIDLGTKRANRFSKRLGKWVKYIVAVRGCRECKQQRDRDYYNDKIKGGK